MLQRILLWLSEVLLFQSVESDKLKKRDAADVKMSSLLLSRMGQTRKALDPTFPMMQFSVDPTLLG